MLIFPDQDHDVGTCFELEIKAKRSWEDKGDVNGKIGTAQRSCQTIGGIQINHIPLVLGREIKRGQIKNG